MPLPVVDYLKLPEDGAPYLEGHKCSSCRKNIIAVEHRIGFR